MTSIFPQRKHRRRENRTAAKPSVLVLGSNPFSISILHKSRCKLHTMRAHTPPGFRYPAPDRAKYGVFSSAAPARAIRKQQKPYIPSIFGTQSSLKRTSCPASRDPTTKPNRLLTLGTPKIPFEVYAAHLVCRILAKMHAPPTPTCSRHVLTAGSGDIHGTKEAPPHVVRSGASDMSEDDSGANGRGPPNQVRQPGRSS